MRVYRNACQAIIRYMLGWGIVTGRFRDMGVPRRASAGGYGGKATLCCLMTPNEDVARFQVAQWAGTSAGMGKRHFKAHKVGQARL